MIEHNKTIINAIRTEDGLIEIVSLEMLDKMVGGLLPPDTLLCQLEEKDSKSSYIAQSQNL